MYVTNQQKSNNELKKGSGMSVQHQFCGQFRIHRLLRQSVFWLTFACVIFMTDAVYAQKAENSMNENALQSIPLQNKLRDILLTHPRLASSRQAVCQANFNTLQAKSRYYPQVSVNLNSGNKIIDNTSRVDQFGNTNSPEYDGRGLNVTLSLRQQLYDWGSTRASVFGGRLTRDSALLETSGELDAQAGELFRLAFDYALQTKLVGHFKTALAAIAKNVEAVEERFKVGAERIVDVRTAQITRLEAEASLSGAQRRQAQAARVMRTRFQLEGADAIQLVDIFANLRPDIPEMQAAERSLGVRILELRSRAAGQDLRRLEAERWPTLYGVFAGRMWDIGENTRCTALASTAARNNCYTSELTANLEFNVPIYDGGANAAQRGATRARQSGLEAELAAQRRFHAAESRRLQDDLIDLLTLQSEEDQKIEDLVEQLESELQLQGRTRSTPGQVASLRLNLANSQARRITLKLRAEVTRMDILRLNNQLAATLNIELGDFGC